MPVEEEADAPAMEIPDGDMPTMDVPMALACRTSNEVAWIQELEEEVLEFTRLDRHIKSMNEALQRTSEKTRAMCEELTQTNGKLENKNKKLSKKVRRLCKVAKALRYKLAKKRPKRKGYCRLEVLAKAVEVVEGAHSRLEEI